MAKDKTIFTCTDCGGTTPRWLGKCPACGAWNTLIESTVDAGGSAKNRYTSQFQALAKTSELTKLGDIEATDVDRSPTGIEELDRALGGGVVEGGVVKFYFATGKADLAVDLSPEVQARAQDPAILGFQTVLNLNALTAEDRARFDALTLGPATLSPADLGPVRLEPHASWMVKIAEDWAQRYGVAQ